ncbi:hypothetical protein [uncultured Candidatus Kuenenia sp.]|uniref:hypothetical protein n=1 Tax=uncultured Candidatus Kuenenia sp. TaxID=1048336 RepID=UPI0002DF9CFE|nr:hypothetical protein [uncultured Candidatus Kuenenia sp.]GJQ48604.1 MAG: hypothetical protein HKUEN01_09900 [Candidatus Kuenenia stuttgartiensis]
MYKVKREFKVKVKGEVMVMVVGSVIDLPDEAAKMFLEQGKIEPVDNLAERMAIMGENTHPDEVLPYVTGFNSLVIPFASPARYHYWQGGQSPCDTLKELGRCDLLDKYRHVSGN